MKNVIFVLLILGNSLHAYSQVNRQQDHHQQIGARDTQGVDHNNANSESSDRAFREAQARMNELPRIPRFAVPANLTQSESEETTLAPDDINLFDSRVREAAQFVNETLNELNSFNHSSSGYTNYSSQIENPDPTRCWYDASGVFNPYRFNSSEGCSAAQRTQMITRGLERLQEMQAQGEIAGSLEVYERLKRNLVDNDLGFEATVRQETAEMMAFLADKIFNSFRDNFHEIHHVYPEDLNGEFFTEESYNQTWQRLMPTLEQEFSNVMQLDRELIHSIIDFGVRITRNNDPRAVQSIIQTMYPYQDENGVRRPAAEDTPEEVIWLRDDLQRMANQLVFDRIEYLRNVSRGGDVGELRLANLSDRPVSEQELEFESEEELQLYMIRGMGTPHMAPSLGGTLSLNDPRGNSSIGTGIVRTNQESFQATATLGSQISGSVGGRAGVEFSTSVNVQATNTIQGGVVFLDGATGQLIDPGNGAIRQPQGSPVFFACSYSGRGQAGVSVSGTGRVFAEAKFFGSGIRSNLDSSVSRGQYDYAARDKRSGFIRVPLRIAGRPTTAQMLADFCKGTFAQARIQTECGRETTLPNIVERDLQALARAGRLRVVEPNGEDKVSCRVDSDCRVWRDSLPFGFSSYGYECAIDRDTGESLIYQVRANSGGNCSTEDDMKYVDGVWSPYCSRNQVCQLTGYYAEVRQHERWGTPVPGAYYLTDRWLYDQNWTCVDPE